MQTDSEAQQEKKALLNNDRYTGVYLDIFGHEGEITFELMPSGDEKTLLASCQIVIFGLGEPQIYRTEKGSEVPLGISGLAQRQDAAFQLTHMPTDTQGADEGDKLLIKGAFEIHLREADPFASKVLFGSVDMSGDPGIGGGTWIAWSGENVIR